MQRYTLIAPDLGKLSEQAIPPRTPSNPLHYSTFRQDLKSNAQRQLGWPVSGKSLLNKIVLVIFDLYQFITYRGVV